MESVFGTDNAFEEAVHYHQAGNLHQAETIYHQVLEKDPSNSNALHLLGVLVFQRGEYDNSANLISHAISKDNKIPAFQNSLGNVFIKQGDLDKAILCFQEAIRLDPNFDQAFFNLGLALQTQGRSNDAIQCFKELIKIKPDSFNTLKILGNLLYEHGDIKDAENCFQEAIRIKPDDAGTLYNLGILFFQQEELEKVIECFQKAVRIEPNFPEAFNNLGLAFKKQGRMEDAERCFHEAIRIRSDFIEALNNLGDFLHTLGRLDEAVNHLLQAIHIQPNFAGAQYNLGSIFLDQGRIDAAIKHLKEAIRLEPNYHEAHNNLGKAFEKQAGLKDAEGCFQKALELKADYVPALGNLGVVLMEQGKLAEAMDKFSRTLEIRADLSGVHSSLLLCLNYQSSTDPIKIFEEHRRWAMKHAEPLVDLSQSYDNEVDHSRRLRIGYVSPDFCCHSVAFFLQPVIEAHDRSSFEVFCYSDVNQPDKTTERLKGFADKWHDISYMPDDRLYDHIRDDKIDILVDLAGHTGNNRLLLFARKPAPIQVNYLGYPNTTGLSTMDYRLTDEWADPLGKTDHYHNEELVRLPNGFLCYRPPDKAPKVGDLPALESGHVTFGSFNNLSKVTPEVVELWSAILKSVPGSRLIMKAKALADNQTCQDYLDLFKHHSVSSEKLRLIGQLPSSFDHLALYNEIDISLDTFPYNGTTTTCEAIWMGVPVVVLAGEHHAARVGVSLLSNMGLTDLIAGSKREYVDTAIQLSQDLDRLRQLRSDLRHKMAQSNLTDPRQFTHSLEDAYRNMWHIYCNKIHKNAFDSPNLETWDDH